MALRCIDLSLVELKENEHGEWDLWLNGMFQDSYPTLTAAIEALPHVPEVAAVHDREH